MVGRCDRRYIREFEGGALICGDGAGGWRGWWGRSSRGEWGGQDGAEWRESVRRERESLDLDGGCHCQVFVESLEGWTWDAP